MSSETVTESNGHIPDEVEEQTDWESMWEQFGSGVDSEMSRSQLTTVITIATDAGDVDEASELIDAARESGDLEYTGSGYLVAGVETERDEEPVTDEPVGADLQEADTDDESGSETVAVNQRDLEEMQKRQDALATQLENVRDENAVLKEAVANLCGVNRVFVDELPDAARERRATNERINATVEKISQQMDSLGDVVDEEKNTKKNRVITVRKHLVSMNENSESEYRMSYREVQSLFSTPGKDNGNSISDSYAHQVMTAAADGDGKNVEPHAAFELKSGQGRKQIAVDMDKIEQGSFYSPKNRGDGEGA